MITGLVIYWILSTVLCLFLEKKIHGDVLVKDIFLSLITGWLLWSLGLAMYLNKSDDWNNFWNKKIF